MRKLALELAVRHMGGNPQNPDTVIYWADKFYEWLTNVVVVKPKPSIPAVTVDPQAPYGSKGMVNKAKLKEKLQERHDAVKGTKWFKQDKHGSYLEAIEDVLRIIDTM